MDFSLRDYQEDVKNRTSLALRRHRCVLVESPTGSGKTHLTSFMIKMAAQQGMGSWFIVHRRELLEQTSATLWSYGVRHGMVAGGKTYTSDLVQIATIQTLARRHNKLRPPKFIVVDEAHHSAAASYRKVIEAYPNAYVVGLTATPCRTDGAGLDHLFDEIVHGPPVSWLIEQGYLAPYRLIGPPQPINTEKVHTRGGDYNRGELEAVVDKASIMGDAVQHYRKFVLEPSKREGFIPSCLVYCVSRNHARHVEEAYRAAGIDARYCAGDTEDTVRRAIVKGIQRGIPPVIVSVDLFGEGLDVPGLRAVQLLRPTQSLSLHLQQVGRALRMEPGKTAIILDHVGNSWTHGLPDDEREWTLEGRKKKRRRGQEEDGPALRHCPSCFAIYPAALAACSACGAPAAQNPRSMPDSVEGQLQEIDPELHRRDRRREEAVAARQGLDALVALAKERGNKPAWAGYKYAAVHKVPVKKAIVDAHRLYRELGS